MAPTTRRLRFASAACFIPLLCSFGLLLASSFWQWTDDKGQTHIADSLEKVPADYRNRATPLNAGSTSQTTAVPTKAADHPIANKATSVARPEPSVGRISALKRIELPYIAQEGSAQRVIVPVTFNNSVTAQMAVDTGSPGLVISFELAERLGLFTDHQGTLFVAISGVGGDGLAIRTIIDSVALDAATDNFVPTRVTNAISTEFEGLIGMDFMSNYVVNIDSEKQVLVLQERSADPQARGGHPESWWRQVFREFRAARDGWELRAKSRNLSERAAALAAFQAREAEVLYQRLEVHASEVGVPREWR
jgi:hypothetical protein